MATEAGGVARSVLDLGHGLADVGAQVTLFSFGGGTLHLPWQEGAARAPVVVLTESPRSRMTLPAATHEALAACIRAADIVHIHGMWEALGSRAAHLARKLGRPYICSIHGMLDPWSVQQRRLKKTIYYALIERRRLAHAAAVHFTAEGERAKSAPWIPAGPAQVVVPVMMDLAPYRELPTGSVAEAMFPQIPVAPWVLFLSRIHEKKGLDILIDAFARLPQAHATAQLVVAGMGEPAYVQQMKALAQAQGVAGRTHFVGMVQGDRKVALYRRASVLAVPTSQENFGIVFTEALACQTPVMLTEDVDIAPELMAAGAGYLVRRDADDVARQLTAILSDPAGAAARGQAGRAWVLSWLEPARIAQQWIEIYERALSARSTAGMVVSGPDSP